MVVIGNWHELRRPSTTTSLFSQISVMNRALPEMLHCLEESLTMNGAEMSVLERQRDRFKWQQQSINESSNLLIPPSMTQQFHGELINKNNCSMNVGLSLDNGSSGFGEFSIPRPDFGDGIMGFGSNGSVRMEGREIDLMTKMASTTVGRESFKKRKADKPHDSKVVVVAAATENSNDKRIKVDVEKVDSKVMSTDQENNREVSIDTSRENSMVKKQDYIHVRARRGQATDSHSLAERVRREKISERMKYLQDLVPGCNKITGKAGMLDEIINYVQSLQRQVEFLSMKLATVNPRLDDNYFKKEMFKTCTESYPTMGVLSEVENPAFLQFNQVQQLVSCTGLEMVINPSEISHERSVIAPVSVSQEAFMDSSCFSQTQPSSTWESDFQSIYNTVEFNQGRPTTTTAFPSQQFHGLMEAANNLKMKM